MPWQEKPKPCFDFHSPLLLSRTFPQCLRLRSRSEDRLASVAEDTWRRFTDAKESPPSMCDTCDSAAIGHEMSGGTGKPFFTLTLDVLPGFGGTSAFGSPYPCIKNIPQLTGCQILCDARGRTSSASKQGKGKCNHQPMLGDVTGGGRGQDRTIARFRGRQTA